MEVKQTNRVNMFKATSAYLADHNSIWNGMVPFASAATRLDGKLAAIDTAAQQQETPTGATQDKAAARDALEDVLFLMCEALSVLGHTANDNDLVAISNVSPTILNKMDAEELSNRGASVLAAANTKKTELATLQVTQANIDELSEALEAFNAAKAAPRMATAERSAQTGSLAALIRDANGILKNEIDSLVNLFRRTSPDFVAGYRAARVIVDRAATHAAAGPTSASTPPVATPNA
jgi:hypothetical protein